VSTTPTPGAAADDRAFWLYLLQCEDGTLYTGIARDPVARFMKHASGEGAAYTRAHPPLRILALRELPNQSEALKAEYALKQIPRERKLQFFSLAERVADSSEEAEPERRPRMRA
jgi:putative endonuclease